MSLEAIIVAAPEERDWICTVEWVQPTMGNGIWDWTLWLIHDDVLGELETGAAFTKLGVYWNIWRACRRHGLKFRINVRGSIPKEQP